MELRRLRLPGGMAGPAEVAVVVDQPELAGMVALVPGVGEVTPGRIPAPGVAAAGCPAGLVGAPGQQPRLAEPVVLAAGVAVAPTVLVVSAV